MKHTITAGFISVLLGLFPLQPVQAAWDAPTLSAMSKGLDAFWGGFLQRLGVKYTYPVVHTHRGAEMTPCGLAMIAHYCSQTNTIHLNMAQMNKLATRIGDSAAYFSLAHEYGHSVQRSLGMLEKNLPVVVLELQADCLAGVFFSATDKLGILEPGDIEEGVIMATMTGDNNYDDPSHHGTSKQRAKAFLSGFRNPTACFQ
jgi:predicted metalloprotease